jgi:peptidoglycan hydrolase-like protein with peptidoglycan-binding domain
MKQYILKYRIGIVVGAIVAMFIMATPLTTNAFGISVLYSGRDLSVGSSGEDVTDLQAILSEQGFLNVPVGVPLGYFGSLTNTAVARFQTFVGAPSTGYFGPITRERARAYFGMKGWLALYPAM